MTKDERSLLLFLETCFVNNGGLVDVRHMNEEDKMLAQTWTAEFFIDFGRLSYADVERLSKYNGHLYTAWVTLSDEAFDLAHQERRARAKRMYEKRNWRKTSEL